MLILVDSREKAPLPFPGIDTRQTALRFGDYTASGLRGVFEIERKAPMDLLATLTVRWRSWVRKLYRWEVTCPRRIVVVEGNYVDCVKPRYDVIKRGANIGMMLDSFQRRLVLTQLTGCSILFCGSRQEAARTIVELLKKELASREQHGEPLNAGHLLDYLNRKQHRSIA